MDPIIHQLCREAVARLETAPHAEHSSIVAELAHIMPGRNGRVGVSLQTAYRGLGQVGWTSGRRQRADKGNSKVTLDELEKVASIAASSRNAKGRINMPAKEALRTAIATGLVQSAPSYGHALRLMRQSGLGIAAMSAPEAGISRQSQHPNHVASVDVSNCLQWYFRDEETGEVLDCYQDADTRFYQNKIENFKKLNRIIHRYVWVDHYSGCYFVWYAYTPGETALDMVDFIWSAIAPKGENGDLQEAYPIRGIPRRILCDQGPGFKSAIVRSLCKDLGIEKIEPHVPGNAKASGSVETRHRWWEASYETTLLLKGARNLEELNRWALLCCAEYNATRLHSRHGATPTEKWCEITSEQLREAPTRDQFYRLAAGTTKTATLTNQLYIRADGKVWEAKGDRIYPGAKVKYRISPFSEAGIRVWDENGTEITATLLEKDPVSGFYTNCRRHVWDDASAPGATAPMPPAQKLARAIKKGGERVSIPEVFDGLEQRVTRQSYVTARGQEWTPDHASPVAAEERQGSLEIREEISRRLGRPLTISEGKWWRARIGDGLTASQVREAWEAFLSESQQTARADAQLLGG